MLLEHPQSGVDNCLSARPHVFTASYRATSVFVVLVLLLIGNGKAQEKADQINALIKQLQSSDKNARLSAASTIMKIGPAAAAAAPDLVAVLRDQREDVEVRESAAFALGQIGPAARDAIPALVAAFRDEDREVRNAAAYALSQIGPEAIPALLIALKDNDREVRISAAYALGKIGPSATGAVPALITAFREMDRNVRIVAAETLGEIGPDAKDAVSDLIAALKERDEDVRLSAVNALSKIGPEAKDAVPTLIAALKDQNTFWRYSAAYALSQIGPEAVPALIDALKDQDREVRRCAAYALGRVGPEAVPELTAALKDPNRDVRIFANDALQQIGQMVVEPLMTAIGDPDVDPISTEGIAQLKVTYEFMKNHPDPAIRKQADILKPTIDYFGSRPSPLGYLWKWMIKHPQWSFLIAFYLLLLALWSLIFVVHPLWLLRLSQSLKWNVKIKPLGIEADVPLRQLLLVSLFHYRPRVLDAWVNHYLVTARENFSNKQTVAQRNIYVPLPATINERMCESLSTAALQPVFERKKLTMLITGEGGAGKTSLACQMATWAMTDDSKRRLCKTHRMLPVLIEADFTPADDKNALVETIRGGLRELIGEPEPILGELLMQLLRKRRVLVIVDSLSEQDETTRKNVRPAHADFPVAALVVTSRINEDLGGASKTLLRTIRLKSDRLSTFMDRYLEQLGKRELFKDKEYFDACSRLSDIVSDRDITVLIAKMYAEQMAAAKEADAGGRVTGHDMPRNLPNLMFGYVKRLNDQVKAERQDIRKVVNVAIIAAWECLKHNCRPTTAKRDDVTKALSEEPDAETLLKYLEERLQLIQTTGPISDLIRFSLDPLAEYLAAFYLVERCGKFEDLWKEFFDNAEKQPGAPETIKGFLLAVRDCCLEKGIGHDVPEWVGDKLAQLAGLNEEAIKPVQLRQRIKLLLANLSSPDDGDRIRAAVALGQIGPEATEAAPALISALKNRNANVSVTAAAALGLIGQGRKEAVLALIVALNDQDGFVRKYAAEALGEFGQEAKEAKPALIAALNDRDGSVRLAVIKAIMKIDPVDERAVTVLIEKLEDEDEHVREYAAKALANFKSAVDVTVPALANAIVDPSDIVKITVIFTLRDLGPLAVKALPALIEALKNHRVIEIRLAAIDALAAIGSQIEEVVLSLIHAQNDKNARIRRSAGEALSTLKRSYSKS